eukprot:gene737-1415_t
MSISKDDKENLDERINVLQGEIQQYGTEIMNHVKSLYSTAESSIDLKNDPRNVIKMLKNDVLDVLKTAKSRSEYLNKHETQLQDIEKLITIVSAVSITSEAISRCDDAVLSSDLQSACKILSEMENNLQTLPNSNTEWGSGTVCTSLRREGNLLRFRFQSRLKRLYSSCIRIERGHINVNKKLKGMILGEEKIVDEAILLSDIFNSLLIIGGIEDVLTEMTNQIWIHIIRPLWKEKKQIIPHVTSTADESSILFEAIARETSVEMFANKDDERNLGACRMAFPLLLEQLSTIFAFISNEICNNDLKLTQIIATKFQNTTTTTTTTTTSTSLGTTLSNTITALLPKTEAELTAMQRQLEKPCRDFDQKMASIGMSAALLLDSEDDDINAGGNISGSGSGSSSGSLSRLSSVVTDLPRIYADYRRREYLSRARDLLLADYHNCMSASGDARDDSPSSAGDVGDARAMLGHAGGGCATGSGALRFESCLVSLASCRLLRLMHEILEQACPSSSRMANILYQTSRDCLELFLAVVSLRFTDVLETVPRMGALFYNDCVYIAHNCTLLSHTYHQGLAQADPSLQGCVGFIDFLPRFRAAGDKCLTKHVEEQKLTLLELVDKICISPTAVTTNSNGDNGSGSGNSNGNGSRMRNNEDAAAVVVRHFDRLRGQWQEVLQESVYERIVGYLVECVLRASMQPLMQADCISEDAGTQIAKVMRVLQGIRTALVRSEDDVIATVAGSWLKFLALQQLLEFSLTEISEALQRRKFSSFTAIELNGLIKALFDESPRRQNILTAIMQMTN